MSNVYYPSCVINFRLRFDEELQRIVPPDPISFDELDTAGGISTDRVLKPRKLPLFIETGDERTSFIFSIIPKICTVELTGPRQSGKFSAVLDFRDLPLDPRLVAAAASLIHFGTVTPTEFAAGMTGTFGAGERVTSILETIDESGGQRADTLAMVGVVDDWKVSHDRKGSEVFISGRDLTGVLLDSPILLPTVAKLDLRKPIGDVVKQVMSFHPQGSTIAPFVRVADATTWPDGKIPSPGLESAVARNRKGARKNKSQHSTNSGKLTFWDVITRLCFLVGAIPEFKGQFLEVRPARSRYIQAKRAGFDPNIPTPFANGEFRDVDGEQLNVRRLLYGRNIEDLELERKLSGRKAQVVEVVGFDPSIKARGTDKVIRERFPVGAFNPRTGTTNKLPSKRSPSGKNDQQEVLRIPVPGIVDRVQLRRIAEALFNEIMRNEIRGSVRTRNLASLGGDNEDPDLLRLRPGDALELGTDVSSLGSIPPIVSELTTQQGVSFEEAVKRLTNRGLDERLARIIVATSRGEIIQLQSLFYTENVRFDWRAGANGGIKVAADFKNYLEAVIDRQTVAEEKKKPARKKQKTRSPKRKRKNRQGKVVISQTQLGALGGFGDQ